MNNLVKIEKLQYTVYQSKKVLCSAKSDRDLTKEEVEQYRRDPFTFLGHPEEPEVA